MRQKFNSIIIFIGIIFLFLPTLVEADQWGQREVFFVDPTFDLFQREQISATLQARTAQLYFYIDDEWWESLSGLEQDKVRTNLNSLTQEFETRIYPTLTSVFGSEPKPGIDKDQRLTILIHPMKKEAKGYFNSADGYSKVQAPRSNEREMVYLNSQYINHPRVSSFLSHEFMHLITFNQKDIIFQVSEETWLNELRSEYVPTLLGYDDEYPGSNLSNRVKEFLKNPNNSLTDWKEKTADYGVINLFSQYLVDHYGVEILVDSLHSEKVGIPSIDYALKKNGFKENFSQVFTDWVIAVLVNDCGLNSRYCYLNQNLKGLRIVPVTNYLPLQGESALEFSNGTQPWAGNWYRFIGGEGELRLEFSGAKEANFRIPYVVKDISGNFYVNFLELGELQKSTLNLSDFGEQIASLTIIPTIQNSDLRSDDSEPYFSFSWKATITKGKTNENEALIRSLKERIAFLEQEIIKVQEQIRTLLRKRISCRKFENNLYLGMRNNEVKCLQEFLKYKESEIYPDGLITGFFGPMTREAVVRLQEKYNKEILEPLGLSKGTGFFGLFTRLFVNKELADL